MRDSKGRFARGGELSIPLPGFLGIYKILIIAILIFPWYVIVSNRNFSGAIFGYLLGNGNNFCPKCEECQECQCDISQSFNSTNSTRCPDCICNMDNFKCPDCICNCTASKIK